MKISTATSHTPALGHAHIRTDQRSHCSREACGETPPPGSGEQRVAGKSQTGTDSLEAEPV